MRASACLKPRKILRRRIFAPDERCRDRGRAAARWRGLRPVSVGRHELRHTPPPPSYRAGPPSDLGARPLPSRSKSAISRATRPNIAVREKGRKTIRRIVALLRNGVALTKWPDYPQPVFSSHFLHARVRRKVGRVPPDLRLRRRALTNAAPPLGGPKEPPRTSRWTPRRALASTRVDGRGNGGTRISDCPGALSNKDWFAPRVRGRSATSVLLINRWALERSVDARSLPAAMDGSQPFQIFPSGPARPQIWAQTRWGLAAFVDGFRGAGGAGIKNGFWAACGTNPDDPPPEKHVRFWRRRSAGKTSRTASPRASNSRKPGLSTRGLKEKEHGQRALLRTEQKTDICLLPAPRRPGGGVAGAHGVAPITRTVGRERGARANDRSARASVIDDARVIFPLSSVPSFQAGLRREGRGGDGSRGELSSRLGTPRNCSCEFRRGLTRRYRPGGLCLLCRG